MEPFDKLVSLAIALGKKKMVLEVKERCGYPGSREEEKKAREDYRLCMEMFLEEARAVRKAGSNS